MKSQDGLVVITGASEGIGRATAARFAAEGHDLLLVARSGDRLASLADDLRSAHGIVCGVLVADVRDAAALRPALTAALQRRPIAAAVVNAGIGLYGPFARSAWTDIENLLRTNFDGAFATASAVLPLLLAQRGGSLVFISSIIGKRALPYNAAYCATKQGLLGLADALRLEARPYGVHVGVVCPARTDTPFFDRMTYAVPQTTRRNVPTNPPEMVAAAVLRCVRRRRREIVVSTAGKLFAFVGWHFPRLSDYLLYRNVPRPDKP
ncbi:MAG: SDR family NAD(P)-dependent oxidoreductase [Bacteroidetes bacterium]|nr:SDR family NAD(P)-dependent oxidoreductase [Bacteroidota bacterium]